MVYGGIYFEMIKKLILSMAGINDEYEKYYTEEDLENGGFGDVVVENFIWDRSKSNLNLQQHSYSFYEARHVYKDPYCHITLDTKHKPNRHAVGDIIENANGSLLLVVDLKKDSAGLVRIISAREIDGGKLSDDYWEHKKRKRANEKAMGSYARRQEYDFRKQFPLKYLTSLMDRASN